jgi:hypothetical protein
MAEAIDHVIGWLLKASSLVGEEYVRLPVADADPQYRERVYCYELYHRLRCQWTSNFPYVLCGEIDKRKHAYVHGDYLDNIKPDFLVHEPGNMCPDSNLLAIEVKPANATSTKIVEDLQKLTALRRALRNSYDQPANYQHAIFWLYGGLPENWDHLKDQLKRNKFEDVDLRLVRCFVHEHAGTRALEHGW